jgi:transcriptional regulator with XRE-family HTH domain
MSSIYLPKDALKLVMAVKGITRDALSKKSKVPSRKIDLILNGMNSQPTEEVLKQLADYLGVSIDALAGNEEIIGAEKFIFSEIPKNTSEGAFK